MKNEIKALLQTALGYERYLRCFAWFKSRTLQWDARERDFFQFLERVPRDGVVLDIGANLGFLSVRLARHVKRGGRVIAFEPMPENVRVLRWLLRRCGVHNVEVYPWALGDSNGSASMVLPVRGRARQQGLGHVVGATGEPDAGIQFEVPVRRLDDVAQVSGPWVRVAAIKMDVENFEQHVLRGALRLLRRDRPLVYLELWDNANRDACFAIAARLGYAVRVCVDDQLVEFDPARHAHGNFFFIPQEPGGERRQAPAERGREARPRVWADAWRPEAGRA